MFNSEFALLKQHERDYHDCAYNISNYFGNNCFAIACEYTIHSKGEPGLDLNLFFPSITTNV